jgi:uncharacterized protein YndB with AHSA1/START domain
MSDAAARELRTEIEIAAPPTRVWATLTDLKQMPDWSPELLRMVPLKPGGLRLGQQYLGVNRRKAVIWPTRNVVAALEPEQMIAWDTKSSGARWIFELEPAGSGSRLVHRRPVPSKLTVLGRAFARLFLGGTDGHADELEAGMAQTLGRLKTTLES